ncbi:FAD-dependent monooxygenase [Hamadaea sp. NPDC051192]|uniref:FAD-dependent monooxygenase n=1 Tax=Hamadaea sp. NPDC051192 TaxID=3154940 RepID=UPI0034259174
MDADVIVVGAGPTGLMLAAELRLAGVRPLVLERHRHPRDVPKANGLSGQILQLLRYRGLLERFEAASTDPHPAPRYPFGGVHLDLTGLDDPPLQALQVPQPRLERLLYDRARELGADIRRGCEVVGVGQDDSGVVVDVRGPDGQSQLRASYLVGCDGAYSSVRDLAGIAFPGITYPDVNRLGQVAIPASVTRHDNGDIETAELGRISAGYTRTDRGVVAFGWLTPEIMILSTVEDELDPTDDTPMTLGELRESVGRILGGELPLTEPRRLSRFVFQARQAETYRAGRILLAGDAAHVFPATGVALNAGLLDTVNLAWKLAADIQGWAPAGLLDTYHRERHLAGVRTLRHTRAQVALRRGYDPAAEALREVIQDLLADEPARRRVAAMIAGTDIRYPMPGSDQDPLTGTFAPDLTLQTGDGTTSVAELMHTARPVLLDLAGRPELREIAHDWRHRIDLRTADAGNRPADALLIRPDAQIAWAATIDEPADTAALALRAALTVWFGEPR